MSHYTPLFTLFLGVYFIILGGCNRVEEIRIHENLSLGTSDAADVPQDDRMLVAFTAHRQNVWFFKMVGPKDAVLSQEPAFRRLIESVRFSDVAEIPQWDTPAEWREEPGDPRNPDRYATLVTDGETPLDIAITTLAARGKVDDAYGKINLNRWRRQMFLPGITIFEYEDHVERLDVNGKEFILASIVGKFSGGSSAAPPFAGPLGPPAGTAPSDDIAFDKPAGWQTAQNDSISRLAFEVADGDGQVRITVSPAGGDNLQNINRWCDQVQHPRFTLEELAKQVRSIKLGDVEAVYVVLAGPADAARRETILGVIAPTSTATWFIKLKGDWQLAERERENFEAFVQSLRFNN